MNKSDAPQIISVSAADLEKLLDELRGPLAPATYQLCNTPPPCPKHPIGGSLGIISKPSQQRAAVDSPV